MTLCQFGDGASNQGTFGETMNLAALWRLPVVFMVTNNQYGMGTALERHSAVTDLQVKGEGFGVPGMECDGMDPVDTYEVTREALRIVREERRPILVEAITYRFRGHSMADPEEYRTKEQVEEWRRRDPIETFGARLVAEDVPSARRSERASTRRPSRASTGRCTSPTPRRTPPPSRCTTTSTCWAARCAAGGRSTSAHRRPTAARTSVAWRPPTWARRSPTRAAQHGGRRDPRRRARHRRRPKRTEAVETTQPREAQAAQAPRMIRYREALNEALREEMQRDERVILMGEDIGVFNGAFKVTARDCSPSSARSGCATRRSPRTRSSAWASARR